MFMHNILRRLVSTLVVLVGVSVMAFVLVRLTPGDPAKMMLPATATVEQVAAMRERMGLDDSYVKQYFSYILKVLHGDLGYSFHYKMSNSELIFGRLGNTAKITVLGIVLALAGALPLGLVAGIKKGSLIDAGAMFLVLLGQAMSPVWLCLLMILVFSVMLHMLPAMGSGTFAHMLMPAVCLGFSFASLVTRMLRSGMIDILEEDYITATRARGIGKMEVYSKYALKNALLPIITISGSQIGILLTGSMVIESIFVWPGLGQLTISAISLRDFQLVQSILLVTAFIMVVCNLAVDIIYTFVDKRIAFN